jgi:ParB family chromosome partitioning protein
MSYPNYGSDFEEIWYQEAEWSQKTFGPDLERGPVGPLKHLAKEVQETIYSLHDLSEYADMQLLLFDATRRAGYGIRDLYQACEAKIKVNKSRKWPKSTSDEPVEHIKEAPVQGVYWPDELERGNGNW